MSDVTPTVINSNGYVSSGVATDVVVGSGATISSLYVTDTGVASATVVSSGGNLYVSSGGVVSGVIVSSGGHLGAGTYKGTAALGADGVVSGATVLAGGQALISAGGVIYDAQVAGTLEVDSGAATYDAVVTGTTALEMLSSGSIDSGAQIGAGASQLIYGAVVSGATISAATQTVYSGGSALATTLSGVSYTSSGSQVISSGGYASGTVIADHGFQDIESGGSAYDTTVASGGEQDIHAGGVVSGVTVASGGLGQVWFGATGSGLDIQSGGSAVVIGDDAGDGTGSVSEVTVESGGTLEIEASIAGVSGLVLQSGGTLALDAFSAGATMSLAGQVLTVSGGGLTETIDFDSSQSDLVLSDFVLASDADSGGMMLNYVACFCPGTMIETADGEAPVETLSIGDMVKNAAGGLRRLRWIGRRSYSADFVENNANVLPVTICAGALEDGVPRRDLRVSPFHAMYVDGALAPAGALVNGQTILRSPVVGDVEYLHLEFDDHELIVADGAVCESYVEDGARGIFQNSSEYRTLYPDARRDAPLYCAPRVEDGERLAAIQKQLAERARARKGRASTGSEVIETNGRQTGSGEEAASPLQGWLDHADRNGVSGWAWDAGCPFKSVAVDILVNDEIVATVTANASRSDLVQAGIGSGWNGLAHSFVEPLDRGRRHLIVARHAGTEEQLAGSPVVLAPGHSFDQDLEMTITRAVAGLDETSDRAGIVSFLSREVERIRHAAADDHADRRGRDDVLQKRRSSGRAGSEHVLGPRALVIDEVLPLPGRDGGSDAILSHIRSLVRLGYQVTVATPGGECSAEAVSNLEREGVFVAKAPFYNAAEDVLRLQNGAFQLVYLHRCGVASAYAGLVKRYQPAARLVYGVADLHHLRLDRQAYVEGRVDLSQMAKRVRTLEITAALLTDAVVTHSSFEAETLRKLAPTLNVCVVPWDTACRAVRTQAADRHDIVFLGNYSHAPNEDAALHLVRTIMPLVWCERPEARCVIAGQGATPAVLKLSKDFPGVHVVGGVNDLTDDLFETARMTVAPLRFGAGLKGKVLASFGAAIPCVMSSVAAEGLPLPDRLRGLVCDEAQDFATQIIRLLGTPETADELGRTGARMMRDHYSTQEVDRALSVALGLGRAAALPEPQSFREVV